MHKLVNKTPCISINKTTKIQNMKLRVVFLIFLKNYKVDKKILDQIKENIFISVSFFLNFSEVAMKKIVNGYISPNFRDLLFIFFLCC